MKYIIEIDKMAGYGDYTYQTAHSLRDAKIAGAALYHEKPGTVYLVSLYPKKRGITTRTHIYRGDRWVTGRKLVRTECALTLDISTISA